VPSISTTISFGMAQKRIAKHTPEAAALGRSKESQLVHLTKGRRQTHNPPNKPVQYFQACDSAHSPAKSTPMAPPIGGDAAKNPKSRFLALPGGTMRVRMETALGI
jgi:hypothetical protein